MPGHEDDRHVGSRPRQFALELEAAQPREPDIEHQATRDIRTLVFQEGVRRAEQPHVKAHRFEQALERVAHGRVVIDDEHNGVDGRLLFHPRLCRAAG